MSMNFCGSVSQNTSIFRQSDNQNSNTKNTDNDFQNTFSANSGSPAPIALNDQGSEQQGSFSNSCFKQFDELGAQSQSMFAMSSVSSTGTNVFTLCTNAVGSVQSLSQAVFSDSAMTTVSTSVATMQGSVSGFLSAVCTQQTLSVANEVSSVLGQAAASTDVNTQNVSAAPESPLSENIQALQNLSIAVQRVLKLLGFIASVGAQGAVSSALPTGSEDNTTAPAGTDVCDVLSDIIKTLIEIRLNNTNGSNTAVDAQNEPTGTNSTESETDTEANDDVVAVDGGRIWGDPHFVGADGGKYDIQGESGKTYNLLSDEGVQMNGTFTEVREGLTVMTEVGLTVDDQQIAVDKDGTLTINGEELGDGCHADGLVEKEGGKLTINAGEYEITLEANGTNLNADFQSDNVNADGIMPHGLWGQSADGDGEARTGDKGSGAQGGGAIEGEQGLTERGDKCAVEMYETDGLFDTSFEHFNRFENQEQQLGQNAGDTASGRGDDIMALIQSELNAMGAVPKADSVDIDVLSEAVTTLQQAIENMQEAVQCIN